MSNHLADATSPYLLQHANNPVDWYPWGPDALDRARRDNRLILLSIGLIPWGASLRRQHVAHGHCRACGYDLRAQRAGRSCPECGTVI